MSKINHTRPELVYRDNLQRELSRVSFTILNNSDSLDAPEIFKPFAEIPRTLSALGNVLEEFNIYLEAPRDSYSMTPPSDAIALRDACRAFGKCRMKNPYDRLYSVHDWLKEAVANRATSNPLYEWLLQMVEAS